MTKQTEHNADARLAFEPLVSRLREKRVVIGDDVGSHHYHLHQDAADAIEIQRIALDFYRRRCDLLQAHQASMRDPERTLVCDILANGQLLPDPAGTRYGFGG